MRDAPDDARVFYTALRVVQLVLVGDKASMAQESRVQEVHR